MLSKIKFFSFMICILLMIGCSDDSKKENPSQDNLPSDDPQDNPSDTPCDNDTCQTTPNNDKCIYDDDCPPHYECVTLEGNIQKCIHEDEVPHCFDYDRDGFYQESSSEYYDECGFGSENPRDPDDYNPLIYPGAQEFCDGVDNSGDGCVDSNCQENKDCFADASFCNPIVNPCWGDVRDYHDYDNSACSAAEIGVLICLDGMYMHAFEVDGKLVPDVDGGKCPTSIDEIPNYAETDVDGFDSNCDGIIDND